METVRKVVEVIDTPVTMDGRKYIKRVEKILMPNGRYRYPVTYIEQTGGFRLVTEEERKARRKAAPLIKFSL